MSYLMYFDEFYDNARKELIDNSTLITEAEKEGVFKDNYYLRDHLQIPFVHDTLAKSVTQEKIIEFTGEFIDSHMKQLSTPGPVLPFTFNDTHTKFFYDLFGVTAQDLLDMYNKVVEETYYGSISKFITGWITNAPHKILIVCILIDAIQNNYNDMIECCEYIYVFCEYPMIYHHFWPGGVKEDVMNYTMEHLGSKYKFIQKKMKTLQELLKYHANVSVEAMKERLRTGADNTYFDFMYRMRNQINNSFRNIMNEYKKNYENNKTLHQKKSQFDDGSLADQEGHTTNIGQTVENTINKFISNGINSTMVKIAAENSQVDKSNLTGYINQIWSVKENRMYRFVEDIITAYFNKNPTSTNIGGSEFLRFGLSLFRSLNSKDPLNQEIRSILDFWMFDIIDIRKSYSNEGTIISYTRAVFNYVILMIVHYN